MAKRKNPPAYQHFKARNLAKVRIDGKDHYLGPYGSPESKAEYERLIAVWQMKQDGFTIRVGELVSGYLEHARGYYVKNGKITSEVSAVLSAVKCLEDDRDKLAVEFGPRALKRARDRMIASGMQRVSINKHVGRIKRIWRWAVSEELLPGSVLPALDAVEGLRKGRSKAVESEPVMPVPDEDVDALRSHVSLPVWGLIQFQRFTGCRPGEAISARWSEINTVPDVWEYRPGSHKTEHHGRQRVICIGPKGQELLCQFIREDPAEFIFCPRDVPGTVLDRDREPGECYDRDAYRRAIERGCKRAGVKHWAPNRLRHSLATEVRAEYGLEAAQVVLGHASAKITEVYAERDLAKAREVMRAIG